MDPRVSTVIPTFRRPALLEGAIKSVQQQTFRGLRICVFDNASGDDTEHVVKRMATDDKRIRYVRQPQNIGALANYNYGMNGVETEFFSLLADDDRLSPDFYRIAVRALDENPKAEFFCGRTMIHNESAGITQVSGLSWSAGLHNPDTQNVLHMLREHFISTGCLFRSRILDTVGKLGPSGSDRNYMVVAAATHPFFVGTDVVSHLYVHGDSFSGGAGRAPGKGSLRMEPAYVLGMYEELEQRLNLERRFSPGDQRAIHSALWSRYHRDLWFVLATLSFARRRRGDLAHVLKEHEAYRLSNLEVLLTRALLALSKQELVWNWARRVISLLHRRIVTLRNRRTSTG